jgi:glycosyltransferase involved in cell wall biosynthesis
MRVGILLSQLANQSLGTDVRVSGILKGLDSVGIETTVLVPDGVKNGQPGRNPPDLPRKRMRFGHAQSFARHLLAWPGLGNAIFWSPVLLRRQIGLLAKGVISLNPDVDILQGEQQLASMAVVEAGRALGLPVVADLHAIWSEELVAYGSTQRGGRADRNVRALESAIATRADHVSVVSPEMREYLISELSGDPTRISVIPNGADPQIATAPMRRNPRRVVFAGMLSPIQNIKLLLQAMSIVCERMPTVEFYLTSKGELAGSVRKQCEKLGLRPRFFWFEAPERLFEFLASCDVGLLPATSDPSRQMAYPQKLYAYMAVGLPIVTNRIGAWSDMVETEGIGIVTDGTPASFANGIIELLEDPSRIQQCGERALTLLRTRYAYAKQAEKFAAVYSELCDHRVEPARITGLESG